MFDITSSKLLILAVVALIVVGPKDLPILLRTVGKYLGVIRRQAAEFRGQLDQAMREAELDQLQKEFEGVRREVRATVDAGTRALDNHIDAPATPAKAAEPQPQPAIGAPAPQSIPEPATEPKQELAQEPASQPVKEAGKEAT